MKVFLGGTCNGSKWREELLPQLTIDYVDPRVKDWKPEDQVDEIMEKAQCDFLLYTITKDMTGVYSIAEVVDDSNKHPQKTLFCVIEDGFKDRELDSLHMVGTMVMRNGGLTFDSLERLAEYLRIEAANREAVAHKHAAWIYHD